MKSKDTKKDDSCSKSDKKTEKLQQRIDELTIAKEELFDKLQRISADYANYQKRMPRQIAESVAYEKKAIIKSLLLSLDNFVHALSSAKSTENTDNQSIIKGFEIVLDHLLAAFKSHGVEIIESLGKPFNPCEHEAIQMRAEEDKPDNVVLEEFQKGYTINGQVLRPSKVIVNKLPVEEVEGQEQEQ